MNQFPAPGRILGTPTGEVDEPFHTMADIGRAVGVSPQSAGRWWQAHKAEVPNPSIDIPMANGERLRLWTAEAAYTFIATYIAARVN